MGEKRLCSSILTLSIMKTYCFVKLLFRATGLLLFFLCQCYVTVFLLMITFSEFQWHIVVKNLFNVE